MTKRFLIQRQKKTRYNGYIWGFPLYNQTVNGTHFNLSVKLAEGNLSETDLPDSLVTDVLKCKGNRPIAKRRGPFHFERIPYENNRKNDLLEPRVSHRDQDVAPDLEEEVPHQLQSH